MLTKLADQVNYRLLGSKNSVFQKKITHLEFYPWAGLNGYTLSYKGYYCFWVTRDWIEISFSGKYNFYNVCVGTKLFIVSKKSNSGPLHCRQGESLLSKVVERMTASFVMTLKANFLMRSLLAVSRCRENYCQIGPHEAAEAEHGTSGPRGCCYSPDSRAGQGKKVGKRLTGREAERLINSKLMSLSRALQYFFQNP